MHGATEINISDSFVFYFFVAQKDRTMYIVVVELIASFAKHAPLATVHVSNHFFFLDL